MEGLLAVRGCGDLMLTDQLPDREDAPSAGLRGPSPPADLGRRPRAVRHGGRDVAAPDDGAVADDHVGKPNLSPLRSGAVQGAGRASRPSKVSRHTASASAAASYRPPGRTHSTSEFTVPN